MQSSVNPRRFIGRPVLLHHASRNDITAVADGLRVGRITRIAPGQGEGWLWVLTGPHCGWSVGDAAVAGVASNPVAARQQLTRSFEAWLAWAMGHEGQVHWHWTEAVAPVSMLSEDVSHAA